MYPQTLTILILCVLLGCIWSDDSRTGQHPWCSSGIMGIDPRKVEKCCKQKFDCAIFIESEKEAYGLKNDSPFMLRLCSCDQMFKKCLRHQKPYDADWKLIEIFLRESCLIETVCEIGEPCDKKIVEENYGKWEAEQQLKEKKEKAEKRKRKRINHGFI